MGFLDGGTRERCGGIICFHFADPENRTRVGDSVLHSDSIMTAVPVADSRVIFD